MKTRKIRIINVLILFTLFLGVKGSFSQETAEEPKYREGEFWIFEIVTKSSSYSSSSMPNGFYEVIIEEGKKKVYQLDASKKKTAEVIAAETRNPLVNMLSPGGATVRLLNFPLSVGKAWTVQYQATDIGAKRPTQRIAESRVVGSEELNIQAGTFRAFKIERESNVGLTGRFKYVSYYSPVTKCMVKHHVDTRDYNPRHRTDSL